MPLRWGDGIVNFEGGGLFNFNSCFELGDTLPLFRDNIVSESCVFGVGEWVRFDLCYWELFIVLRTNLATGDLKLSMLLFLLTGSAPPIGEFDLNSEGFWFSFTVFVVFEVNELGLLVRSKSTCTEIDFGDCWGLHCVSQLTSWGLVFTLFDTICAVDTLVKVRSIVWTEASAVGYNVGIFAKWDSISSIFSCSWLSSNSESASLWSSSSLNSVENGNVGSYV